MRINDTRSYYVNEKDPSNLMDDELTISHLLRKNNPFTGKSFGEVIGRHLKIGGKPDILEIGPGLGDLANGLIKAVDFESYTFLDISPGIMDHLKARFGSRFNFVLKDVLEWETGDAYDLIVCNEVLADLPTITDIPNNPVPDEIKAVCWEHDLDIKEAPDNFSINIGAIRFLGKAVKWLKPGGLLLICEHGSDWPRKLSVRNHDEYSVKFDFMETVLEKLNMESETKRLTDLLDLKDEKFVCLSMQPELRVFYRKIRQSGKHDPWTSALTVDQASEVLKSLRIDRGYEKYLRMNAKPLHLVTDQFFMLFSRKFVPRKK